VKKSILLPYFIVYFLQSMLSFFCMSFI